MSKRSKQLILDRLKGGLPLRSFKAQVTTTKALGLQWLDTNTSLDSLINILTSLSAVVRIARARKEVQSFLKDLIIKNQIKKAVLSVDPLLERAGITTHLLGEMGVAVQKGPNSGPGFVKTCSQADLGITTADAMVDESGSLIIRAKQGNERALSLLPPVHVAVIEAKRRVARVSDLVGLLRSWKDESPDNLLPSAVHLITGPSRTADIEFTLVLGAHGPRILHVLILDF